MFAGITIYGHSDHTTAIIVEFTSKNDFGPSITVMCLRVLPYMVTPITQQPSLLNFHFKTQFQTINNSYVFAGITIYGHSDHATAITVEFTSKNNFRPSITVMC